MEMAYWYWKRKGIRPSEFLNIPMGERAIIRAFFELELEEMSKMEHGCPAMYF